MNVWCLFMTCVNALVPRKYRKEPRHMRVPHRQMACLNSFSFSVTLL